MKVSSAFSALSLLVSAVITTPVPDEGSTDLEKRAVWSTCGSWGTSVQGTYTLVQNLWGKSAASSGSQCISLNSVSGNTFAWSTSWSWAGGTYNVKSYDNLSYNINTGKSEIVERRLFADDTPTGVQVSKITSIPATWNWSQSSSGTPVCDVAFDLMTSSSSSTSSTHAYEIMIWLGAYGGAGPISSSGSPVATPTIVGKSWKLYDGYNGSTRVFSFVATSTIKSFSGDLKAFLTYLASNKGFPTSQYLTVLQAGTEPFTGSNVVFTTSKYTVALNHS